MKIYSDAIDFLQKKKSFLGIFQQEKIKFKKKFNLNLNV